MCVRVRIRLCVCVCFRELLHSSNKFIPYFIQFKAPVTVVYVGRQRHLHNDFRRTLRAHSLSPRSTLTLDREADRGHLAQSC